MTDSIQAFLSRLHHPMLASIDLSLDRMYRLLAMLGNPHKRLPPVIHVAGTNGKGSLLANLKGIFEAGGYRVHRYTSPQLVRFSERIVLAGEEIDNARLEAILGHVSRVLASQPATFFEAVTAAAFLAFAEKPADVLLLETGMGGRLDATNVIDAPRLTAITPIAFDHTEFLGKTLEKIAAEKAGILKKNVACVVGKQDAEALKVIEEKAQALHSPLFRMGQEWRVEKGIYQSAKRTLAFTPALAGDFQYDNAASAIACIDQLPEFTLSDAQIAEGISRTVWPARLQHLTDGKLRALLPENTELWFDGGHNVQGAQMLAQWLEGKKDKTIYLVCGMIQGKDAQAFLKLLAPYARALYGVAISEKPAAGEPASRPPAQIASAAQAAGIEAHVAANIEAALRVIAQRIDDPSLVCICGSLYLARSVIGD